jgi:hypothetical protein
MKKFMRLFRLSKRIYVLHHDLVYGFCSKHFRAITILPLSGSCCTLSVLLVLLNESCLEQAMQFALTVQKMSFSNKDQDNFTVHLLGDSNSCWWIKGGVYIEVI